MLVHMYHLSTYHLSLHICIFAPKLFESRLYSVIPLHPWIHQCFPENKDTLLHNHSKVIKFKKLNYVIPLSYLQFTEYGYNVSQKLQCSFQLFNVFNKTKKNVLFIAAIIHENLPINFYEEQIICSINYLLIKVFSVCLSPALKVLEDPFVNPGR